MLKFMPVGRRPPAPLALRKASILARIRRLRTTEIEQDEERPLEGMLHWRDPVERLRMRRRRNQTLVDDNPASG